MKAIQTFCALAGAASLTLAFTGCEKHQRHEAGEHAKADVAAIKDAIVADEKKWSDEFQAKPRSLDALLAHYAQDAYFVAPGVKPASGMAEITKTYQEGMKDPNFNITFAADKVEVAQAGDMATSQGRFTETYTDPATKKTVSAKGSFLTVYKKQPDGSWKAIQDWAVADPAAAPAG